MFKSSRLLSHVNYFVFSLHVFVPLLSNSKLQFKKKKHKCLYICLKPVCCFFGQKTTIENFNISMTFFSLQLFPPYCFWILWFCFFKKNKTEYLTKIQYINDKCQVNFIWLEFLVLCCNKVTKRVSFTTCSNVVLQSKYFLFCVPRSFNAQEALATIGEKLCVELSQCLSQHGYSPFSADRKSTLRGQISAIVHADNTVRKLMGKNSNV